MALDIAVPPLLEALLRELAERRAARAHERRPEHLALGRMLSPVDRAALAHGLAVARTDEALRELERLAPVRVSGVRDGDAQRGGAEERRERRRDVRRGEDGVAVGVVAEGLVLVRVVSDFACERGAWGHTWTYVPEKSSVVMLAGTAIFCAYLLGTGVRMEEVGAVALDML